MELDLLPEYAEHIAWCLEKNALIKTRQLWDNLYKLTLLRETGYYIDFQPKFPSMWLPISFEMYCLGYRAARTI